MVSRRLGDCCWRCAAVCLLRTRCECQSVRLSARGEIMGDGRPAPANCVQRHAIRFVIIFCRENGRLCSLPSVGILAGRHVFTVSGDRLSA